MFAGRDQVNHRRSAGSVGRDLYHSRVKEWRDSHLRNPAVSGGAPAINTLYTMWMNPPKGEINPRMWVGMVLVPIGAAMALYFRPAH